MQGGFAAVAQGEAARQGIAIEPNGTEVGVVVRAGGGVAAGDGERVAAQADLRGDAAALDREGEGIFIGVIAGDRNHRAAVAEGGGREDEAEARAGAGREGCRQGGKQREVGGALQLEFAQIERGFAAVAEGEAVRNGITVETRGAEVGVILTCGGTVAAGDVDVVATEGDLGLGQFEAELQHRCGGGVDRGGGGLTFSGQAFEPAILAGQGFDEGEVAAAAACVAQGDEQVAALIDIGGVEAQHGSEGIGIASARVGAGGDRQCAAATRDGIGADVVGKGRAELAGCAGGGAEFNAVRAPVAWTWGPGGLTDPEAEGQSLDLGAGRQVAQQLLRINELHRPGIGAQRHVQAVVPGLAGRHGEGGGCALAGDREAVGASEAVGGGDLQIEQVEAVNQRDGRTRAARTDGQQGRAVQAEVDQRARVFGGGAQAQAGRAGRHREGVAFGVRIERRIEAAGVGREVGQAVVGGQAFDRAEAECRRTDGALVGRAVVAKAERPGAVGLGRCQTAEGGVEAGDGGRIGLAGTAGGRGSILARRHGRRVVSRGPQVRAGGAVGEDVGAVEVRTAAVIGGRSGADATEQDQAAAAARRGQHGLEIARPAMAECQADGDAADVLGEAADRDRHRQGGAGRGRGFGDTVWNQPRAGTRDRVGEGIKGGVQVHRQGAFETAAGVAKDEGRLVLPASQVGGGGFESDADHDRSTWSEGAGRRAHGEPRGVGGCRPVEGAGTAVGQGVAASAGSEGPALGAGGDQTDTTELQGIGSGGSVERGFGHDDADPGVAVGAGRLDVECAGVEQGADLGGAEVRIVGLQQARDRRCVGGGRRGAIEGGEAGHRGGDAVGGGEIGFGEQLPAAGGEIAGREGRAIGLVKHPARTVAAEGFDRVAGGERRGGAGGCRRANGGDAEGVGGAGGIVTAGLAGGAEAEAGPAGAEVQVAVRGSGFLHDDDAFAGVEGADRLIRVLAAGLQVGRAAQHAGAGAVEDEEIVVIGGGAVGIGPEQVDTPAAATGGDGVVSQAAPEVVQGAGGCDWRTGGTTCREVALPNARGAVVLVAGVAGGRKEQHAGVGDGVDRLGDDHVLEGRFVEVSDVVDNDRAAGGLQGEDVAGEAGVAVESGGKQQFRARQQVLDDFHHRRALVAGTGLAAERPRAGVELAGGFGDGQRVGAIGEHADFQSRAVDTESGARAGGQVGGVASGEYRTEVRFSLNRGFNEADLGPCGQGFELGRCEAGAQAVETRHRGEDLAAASGEPAFEFGRDAAAYVDEQTAVGLGAHRGLEFGQRSEVGGAGLTFEQVDELRIEPGLGRGAAGLFRQQGGDLSLGSFTEALSLGVAVPQREAGQQEAEQTAQVWRGRRHGCAAEAWVVRRAPAAVQDDGLAALVIHESNKKADRFWRSAGTENGFSLRRQLPSWRPSSPWPSVFSGRR